MPKKERKARNKIKKKKVDFLKPIDITQFGTDDDPCFGKHYNLAEKECKRCGDSEICGLIFSQGLHKKRKKVESKYRFKDMELEPKKQNESLKKWVKEKMLEGKKRYEVIKLANKTFGSTRKEIKQIYKTLQDELPF